MHIWPNNKFLKSENIACIIQLTVVKSVYDFQILQQNDEQNSFLFKNFNS